MKKILLIALAVLVAAALVTFMVIKQQSGYTKVLTATLARQDLTTIISGTGQIKPKTYVNVGATAMGRVTHLYVKEGDRVKKGETVATIENVQQEATVNGQQATIAAAKTDIASYIAAEKTAEANVEHAQADLEQKKLDWERAQALYKDGIMAKQDYDAKKAAYDLDVASRRPGRGRPQPGQGQYRLRPRPLADPGRQLCAPIRTCSTAPSPSRRLTAS